MTLLRFTPPTGGDGMGRYVGKDHRHYYFVRLGLQWPHDPSKRLIDETAADKAMAKTFENDEAAREVLVVAGRPPGWELVEA